MPEIKAQHASTVYDLVANIVHDGEPDKGTYRVHLLHKVSLFFCYMSPLFYFLFLNLIFKLYVVYLHTFHKVIKSLSLR